MDTKTLTGHTITKSAILGWHHSNWEENNNDRENGNVNVY